MNIGRPSQKKQPSRKGKKAWRKNIDLDGVEQAIEDARDTELVLGSQPLFEVDTQGNVDELTRDQRSERKLKAHEILSQRSKVPALKAVHKKKDKPKPKVKIADLLTISGRTGEDTAKARIEHDGLIRNNSMDIWGDAPVASSKVRVARPETLGAAPEAPLPGTKAVELPREGRSYNPALESWRDLISEEHAKLQKGEEKEALVKAEKARIEQIIAEEEEKVDDYQESSSDEEVAEEDVGKLSVGAPVQNKKKTLQQRSKQRRHKERMELQDRLKILKRQLRELQEMPIGSNSAALDAKVSEPKLKVPKVLKKAHSKNPVMTEPLAVKLSDELGDPLRRLRPEGNPLKEKFRNLQARGLIEARMPASKKRKHARKFTEKWSYKDFDKTRGT